MKRSYAILVVLGLIAILFFRANVGTIPENSSVFFVAAEDGDAFAQAQLGHAYITGDGVEKDVETGIYWIERAAKQNDAYALYVLGSVVEQGLVSNKNSKQAVAFYRRAAALNEGAAQLALARLYAGDALGEPNYLESHKWQILANAHGWRLRGVDFGAAQNLNAAQLRQSEAAAAALQEEFEKL